MDIEKLSSAFCRVSMGAMILQNRWVQVGWSSRQSKMTIHPGNKALRLFAVSRSSCITQRWSELKQAYPSLFSAAPTSHIHMYVLSQL